MPNDIKSEFEIDQLEPGGLIYEFDIVLAGHKKWIEKKFRENGYRITEEARMALQKAEHKIKSEKFITELQFDKLSKEVVDLENRLDSHKPSNIRSNVALIVSGIALVIELIRLLKGK